MNQLHVGDFIKCHDPNETAELSMELTREGYLNDFVYSHNGEQGYWLEILKEPSIWQQIKTRLMGGKKDDNTGTE